MTDAMTDAPVATAILPTRRPGTSRLAAAVPPILFGVAFLGLWEGAVHVFDLKPYFLPLPSKIFSEFLDEHSLIWGATKVSGFNALVGLIFGTVLGVLVAFVLRRFPVLGELVTPLAIAVNAVPIFILVSVFNKMFAITSEVPRRLMVLLVVYFIVLVNVAKGLTQVDRTHLELMRSYAAPPREVMRKVRIPNAVPYLFTALRIAAPAAVITAFVSEYFGGSQNGLGNRITSNISNSQNAVAWAYVLAACLLGLTFFLISTLVESVVTSRGAANRREGRA